MKYCEEYAALLDLFVDGELSLEEMLRVQEHLDTCPACRAYVDDALAMSAAVPDAEETEVPADFAAGVMAHIQSSGVAATPKKKKKTPWVGLVASLAACCAIVIIQQNGPLAGGAANMESAAAYTSVAAADDAMEEASPEAPAEFVAVAESTAESDASAAPINAAKEAPDLLADDAEPGEAEESSADIWAEGENVVFACVVFLPQDRVGTVLDEYEGKPYSTEEGLVGIGYALEQSEFERILYDEFDYTHGPELNPDRTTDLCCIVVTE